MKPSILISSIVFSLSLGLTPLAAQDLPKSKQTSAGLYVTAAEAAAMLTDPNVVLVDVRTRSEVAFVGLPTRANVHLPYMQMPMVPEVDPEKGTYKLEINPDFPVAFKEWAASHNVTAGTPIILMCRSGSRSAKAADLLSQMGYSRVFSMIDGFEGDKAKEGDMAGQRVVNGWRNAGLQWSYKISPEQAYPDDL